MYHVHNIPISLRALSCLFCSGLTSHMQRPVIVVSCFRDSTVASSQGGLSKGVPLYHVCDFIESGCMIFIAQV